MRVLSFILILAFAAPVFSQCSWAPVQGPSGNAPANALVSGDCFQWDNSSSIHFENNNCKCSLWWRIRGRRTTCGTGPECNSVGYNTARLSVPGLQNPNLPTGPIWIENSSDVECGGAAGISVSSNCACIEDQVVMTTVFSVDPASGAIVPTVVVTHNFVTHCGGGVETNVELKGTCTEDCDTANPPANQVFDTSRGR